MADLEKILISVQAPDGSWGQPHLANLTSEQFEDWAATKAPIPGGRQGMPWTYDQRSQFVDWYRATGGHIPEGYLLDGAVPR